MADALQKHRNSLASRLARARGAATPGFAVGTHTVRPPWRRFGRSSQSKTRCRRGPSRRAPGCATGAGRGGAHAHAPAHARGGDGSFTRGRQAWEQPGSPGGGRWPREGVRADVVLSRAEPEPRTDLGEPACAALSERRWGKAAGRGIPALRLEKAERQGQQKDRRCGGEGWVWRAGGRSQQRQHGPEAGPASVLALRPPRPGVWWASWAPAPAPHARLTILRPTPSSALGVFSTGHWGRVAALDKGAAAPPPGLSEHRPAPVTDPGDRPGDRPAPVESCPLLPGARCAEWKPPETVLPPFPPAGGSAPWLPPGAAASLAASQHGARKGRAFLGKRRVSWWLLRARYQRFSGQNYARRRMDHAERAARASVLCRGGPRRQCPV